MLLRNFKSILNFSRKVQKQIDPQDMIQKQMKVIEVCQKRGYKIPEQFKHQDILFEEELYGKKCQISGITENNHNSAEFTKQVLETSKPNLVILGGWNDTEAMAELSQPMKTFLNIQNLQTAKLYCKTTLLPVIQKRLQTDKNYYFDQKKKVIWRTDHLNRQFMMNDYLNAAYMSMFLDYKLIYGKPSSIIIYEDLMLTLSLQDLQEMFQNTINKIKQKHPTCYQYSSSVLLEHVKTYSMYEQPKLYSKEVTYTTALLNRLTKIQNKNLLLIPTCFVKKVADQVHKINFEPENVYRNWIQDTHSQNYGKLIQIVQNQKITQILSKFAILSILKGLHLQLCIHQGKNIFNNSIFSQLLGSYKTEQILHMYRPLKSKYMEKLFSIQRQRIKNIVEYHPPQTNYMYLRDQFQTLQKRKQMFLYDYEPKNHKTLVQNSAKIELLNKKVDEIVESQCDDYQRSLYEQFKKGSVTKQGIILYSKLIGKANVQLTDKVRLPYYHFNAFRGFYKQYLRDHLLFDENKKTKREQMKKLRKLQQNFQKIGRQIKDPQLLKRYLSGQMGPVKQLNMYQGQNGQIDMDGQLQQLQGVIAELGNDQMKKDYEQFRKKYKTDQQQEFGAQQQQLEQNEQQDSSNIHKSK